MKRVESLGASEVLLGFCCQGSWQGVFTGFAMGRIGSKDTAVAGKCFFEFLVYKFGSLYGVFLGCKVRGLSLCIKLMHIVPQALVLASRFSGFRVERFWSFESNTTM